MLPRDLKGLSADEIRAIPVARIQGSFARFQLLFGLIFTMGALAFGIFGVIQPALQIRAASNWVQTPCTITDNTIVRGIGRSSTKRPSRTTFTLTLAYEYQHQGRSYRGKTYSFDKTEVSGWEEASRTAKEFPRGATTICWINPQIPGESVLKRDAQQPPYLLLAPIILLAAGIGICFNAWKTMQA